MAIKLISIIKKFIEKPFGSLISLILFFNIIFDFLAIKKYFKFGYNAMDLGIINNVFYRSLFDGLFTSSIHFPSYLGDHISLIIFPLLPIYKLWPEPLMPVLMQIFIISLCAWPIYLIASLAINKKWGLIFSAIWLINPFVQNFALFEVSFLPYAAFFVFWTFYFYQKKQLLKFLFASILTCFCREDATLVVASFGILAFLQKRKIAWQIFPLFFGLSYFFIALKIIGLYAGDGGYKFLLYYSWLGENLPDMVKNLITKPWIVLPHILNPGSMMIFFALLLPLGFWALFSPIYLILSAPIFLQLISGTHWQLLGVVLYTQYTGLLLPGIFIASIFGFKKLFFSEFIQKAKLGILSKEKNIFIIISISSLIYGSIGFGLIGSSFISKKMPIKTETESAKLIVKNIEPSAPIAASYSLLSNLSSRSNIYSLNYIFLGKQQFLKSTYAMPENTQYIVFDSNDWLAYYLQYGKNLMYKNQYEIATNLWPEILNDFGLIQRSGQIYLFKKGQKNLFLPIEILPDDFVYSNAQSVNLENNQKFLGAEIVKKTISTYWQMNLPLKPNWFLKLSLTQDGEKTIKYYPFDFGFLDKKIVGLKKLKIEIDLGPKELLGDYELIIEPIEILEGQNEINAWRSTQITIQKSEPLGPEINLGKLNF